MTAATTTRPTLVAAQPTPPRDRPVGIGRLTAVELRKAVDTRSGRWLLAVIALVGLAAIMIATFGGKASDHDYLDIAGTGGGFVAVLLPVLGILLVTSEWSQRTAQTTFTLVPRRGRVIVAKALAAGLLAVGAGGFCAAVAAPFTLLASHPAGHAVWHVGAGVLTGLLYQVLFALSGVAFGLLFLNSPLAIVVFFVLPSVWSTLASSVHALHGVRQWLDTSASFNALLDSSASGKDWAQILVSALVWIGLPALVGVIRVRRKAIG